MVLGLPSVNTIILIVFTIWLLPSILGRIGFQIPTAGEALGAVGGGLGQLAGGVGATVAAPFTGLATGLSAIINPVRTWIQDLIAWSSGQPSPPSPPTETELQQAQRHLGPFATGEHLHAPGDGVISNVDVTELRSVNLASGVWRVYRHGTPTTTTTIVPTTTTVSSVTGTTIPIVSRTLLGGDPTLWNIGALTTFQGQLVQIGP